MLLNIKFIKQIILIKKKNNKKCNCEICGKECLIIWEDEVNENNKEKLIIKINNFINSLKS